MSSESNPWKTVSFRTVYENPWNRFEEHVVVRPDGSEGVYGVVCRPRSNQVVLVDASGRICIVGQWRYPTGRYSWELPGGQVNEGEDPVQAAVRELLEETGSTVRDVVHLGTIDLLNGLSDVRVDVVLAHEEHSDEADGAEEEGIDAKRWVTVGEFISMIGGGGITSPPSIASLLLYLSHVGRIKDQ